MSCLLPLFRNFPGLDFLRWARKGVRPLTWPAKAVQCKQLLSQWKSSIFRYCILSALNLKESGKKHILKIVKYSLGPTALYEKQCYYNYLTMERSEIIQWTAIMFSNSLILEHKKQFILTPLFGQYMTCLYGQEPLSVSGQSLPAFLIFFLLWRLMVTSFAWLLIKVFFLFLFG